MNGCWITLSRADTIVVIIHMAATAAVTTLNTVAVVAVTIQRRWRANGYHPSPSEAAESNLMYLNTNICVHIGFISSDFVSRIGLSIYRLKRQSTA